MKGLRERQIFQYITWTIIYFMLFNVTILNTRLALAEATQEDLKDTPVNTQPQTIVDEKTQPQIIENPQKQIDEKTQQPISEDKNAQAPQTQLGEVEKAKKLETAVNLFKEGNDVQAKVLFLSSKEEDPTNPVSAYYLALIYTKEDNLKDAISEWKRYIKLDPKSDTSIQARQYLTILVKEDAKRFAAQSVKEEAKLEGIKTDENTVAVTYFHNTGSEDINPLSKGLAAMLITDISQVKDLKVVEREKINAIYDEMKLSESGLIKDGDTSKIGKLVLARNISTGSYGDPIPTELDITSVVINSEDNKEKGTHSSKGKLTEFFDMEKDVAKGILITMNYDWASLPEGLKKIHTKNYEAFKDYSIGLDYMDKENYDKAKEAFKKAIDLDPNFDLAKEAYLSIPVAALTIAAIIATATTAAPAAAGVTVVGATAASAGTTAAVGTTTAATTTVAATTASTIASVVTIGASAVGTVAVGASSSGSIKGSGIAGSGGGGGGGSAALCNDPGTNWGGTFNITAICGVQLNTSGSWTGSIDNNCMFTFNGDTTQSKETGSTIVYIKTLTTGNCAGQTITFNATISGTTLSCTISGATTGTMVGTKQ